MQRSWEGKGEEPRVRCGLSAETTGRKHATLGSNSETSRDTTVPKTGPIFKGHNYPTCNDTQNEPLST